MNYLVIKNKGLIEPEDLYLIGSSTKREDENKIGMFGSGWKFALAWLMRNDCLPKVFSGKNSIDIDFNFVPHRNTQVRVITINGKQTSLTSEMGLKWTGWMAIREIISNAIDEGEYTINTSWNPETFYGEEDKTTIYIPMNNELADVMRGFNNYFSFERTVSFENSVGRLYFKNDNSEMVVYRKGIRCFDPELQSKTDFDFNSIEIDENRLCQNREISEKISNLVTEGVPTSVLKHLLLDGFINEMPFHPTDEIIESLKELINYGDVFTCPALQGIGGVFLVQNATLIIPNRWFDKLSDLGLVENPFSKFKDDEGAPKNFIRTDAKNISKIKYYLDGLNLNYNYITGLFDGVIKVSKNNVYINDNIRINDEDIATKIIYHSSEEFFKSQLR